MVDFFPHQLEAIREMKNGSVLRGGVGSGKSRTALGYFVAKVAMGEVRINDRGDVRPPTRPKDIYIITVPKKRDKKEWEGEAAPFGFSTVRDFSFGGCLLTVDSFNNIGKYEHVKDAFFVFDENRLVGSGAWVKSFLKIVKHNEWILLSATPGDTWIDWIPLLLAHGHYKNRTEFARRHIVFSRYSKWPKVDHFVEVQHLERLKRDILVEMPYLRHTKRHVRSIMVDYNKAQFDRVVKDRWHVLENRPLKDVGEMFVLMRKIVNSDVSRLGAVIELSEKHPRLIVFYSFTYELIMLRTLANTLNMQVAEWNGIKHEELPTGEEWIYLVQYASGAEGWNCTTTDAMVFYSLSYSYKLTEQSKGRIDRLNTPYVDLWYYQLRSDSSIDKAIVRSLAGKRDFNESEFLKHVG